MANGGRGGGGGGGRGSWQLSLNFALPTPTLLDPPATTVAPPENQEYSNTNTPPGKALFL